MLAEKSIMTVEDDLVYLIIHYLVYNMNQPNLGQTAQGLYLNMLHAAGNMGMEDFGGKYGRYRSRIEPRPGTCPTSKTPW